MLGGLGRFLQQTRREPDGLAPLRRGRGPIGSLRLLPLAGALRRHAARSRWFWCAAPAARAGPAQAHLDGFDDPVQLRAQPGRGARRGAGRSHHLGGRRVRRLRVHGSRRAVGGRVRRPALRVGQLRLELRHAAPRVVTPRLEPGDRGAQPRHLLLCPGARGPLGRQLLCQPGGPGARRGQRGARLPGGVLRSAGRLQRRAQLPAGGPLFAVLAFELRRQPRGVAGVAQLVLPARRTREEQP